ncbi:MAG: acylneuraminate cytidylyltransferase family protein [Alphaproteobacteria bacterium]|nr:MAG: acylneuraminate cytidylyltransferase family protein [Alphaproteobacteria bacterium]
MKTIATICARGGSVGLKNKNILDFCGKPLIAHSILQAKACSLIDEVYVSTDSEKIAEVAKEYGAQVPFLRPKALATDTAGKIPVIMHCLNYLNKRGESLDLVIDLQPTSPIRSSTDIKNAIKEMSDDVDVVFSVSEAKHNPYFTLVEVNKNGIANLSKKPNELLARRQDAPKAFGINGSIYVWKPQSLIKGLWGGKAKVYIMPKYRSIDIDDDLDFEYAKLIYRGYK